MVDSQSINPEPKPISPIESTGQILAKARSGWDLTIEEVAEGLNLSVNTIKALERDDYDQLPGYTFVRGYIRSYANLLRLNPDEVLTTVDVQPERLAEIPAAKGSIKLKGRTRGRTRKKKRGIFKTILFLLILIVLSLVGLNQWSKLDTQQLATIFKFPTSGSSKETNEEPSGILLPGNETSKPGSEGGSGDQKEALIRIE